jgi:hypothetical protein
MNKLRLRLARLALALGVAAACWACNAPFIPIPPPGQTATFTSALVSDDGGAPRTVWVAHGPPVNPPVTSAALARVFVFDTNRMAGVIAEALDDGSYTSPPMDGDLGDRVEIWFETTQGAVSQSVCFLLTTDVVPSAGNVPSAPRCPQQ